ncbi:MAG: tetratricopeptide repeat protein, partial [Gallionellaceae bacterium]
MSEQNNMDATFGQLKQQWMDTKDQAKVDEIVTQLKVLAEKGHGPANALLGKIFDSPRNKKRDEIAALDYLEQAVKLKVPEAFSDLGLAYQNRNELEKAAALFKEGAELGDASSMGSLGDLLIAGEGVAKDSINGIRWLKKAADAGDNYAKKVYAFQLIIGEAITADPAKAIEILDSEFKEQREGAVAYNIA